MAAVPGACRSTEVQFDMSSKGSAKKTASSAVSDEFQIDSRSLSDKEASPAECLKHLTLLHDQANLTALRHELPLAVPESATLDHAPLLQILC